MIMSDLNAKVGKEETKTDCTRTFGLGEQNERGGNLIDRNTNNFVITNTLFQHHPRHLYTWISPDKKVRNQMVLCSHSLESLHSSTCDNCCDMVPRQCRNG